MTATFADALWNQIEAATPVATSHGGTAVARAPITREMIAQAEALVGLSSSDAQRAKMVKVLENFRAAEETLRLISMPNSVQPAIQFSALLPGRTAAGSNRKPGGRRHSEVTVSRPRSAANLAFLSVVELAHLIRTRQVTSTELTRLYLQRLKRHDPTLHCVATLTEARALRQAAALDRETVRRETRGTASAGRSEHGIPSWERDYIMTRSASHDSLRGNSGEVIMPSRRSPSLPPLRKGSPRSSKCATRRLRHRRSSSAWAGSPARSFSSCGSF